MCVLCLLWVFVNSRVAVCLLLLRFGSLVVYDFGFSCYFGLVVCMRVHLVGGVWLIALYFDARLYLMICGFYVLVF